MKDVIYIVRENGHICEDILEAWDWQDAGFTVIQYLGDKYLGEMK